MQGRKTYVVICGFADVVAGGPIYYANKVRYMKDLGWNVVVIPTNKGKHVYIHGMEQYLGPYVPFILDMPSEYPKRQREKLVDYLQGFIPQDTGETIIETGTDYTCYWGEALAERIKAKHIVIFLDEQNPRVDEKTIGFYLFKYDRHEMACISKPVMQNMFKKYRQLSMDECYGLPCACTNSIEDYKSPLTEKIKRSEWNIGYIGRLEKPFTPTIVDGFVDFCKAYTDKKITITFFGGAFEQKTIDNIRSRFSCLGNVSLIISGYIFPLPLKALQKIDVYVSGSGSARVAMNAGIYSVKVDMLSYMPLGLIRKTSKELTFDKCPHGNRVFDYLKWVLVDKDNLPPRPVTDYLNDIEFVNTSFEQHIKFIDGASKNQAYYDMEKLGISDKRRKKRFFRSILGLPLYNFLHNCEAWALGIKAKIFR